MELPRKHVRERKREREGYGWMREGRETERDIHGEAEKTETETREKQRDREKDVGEKKKWTERNRKTDAERDQPRKVQEMGVRARPAVGRLHRAQEELQRRVCAGQGARGRKRSPPWTSLLEGQARRPGAQDRHFLSPHGLCRKGRPETAATRRPASPVPQLSRPLCTAGTLTFGDTLPPQHGPPITRRPQWLPHSHCCLWARPCCLASAPRRSA